jgi:CHAD domain-containing protein
MKSAVDLEIRKRENFRQGILRMLDTLHNHSARLIVAGSRQHISVHELRKNIKKIRGILRLIRHEIGHDSYHELNDYYRTIAREVAVLRDDTSQIELLQSMSKKVNSADIKRTISSSIRQVEKKRKNEFDRFYDAGKHIRVRALFNIQKGKNHYLGFQGDPGFFILKSLKRIHHRARSSFEVSTFYKNDEVYHYWRKQVKYLMYQLNILNNAWPSYFKIYISELNKLGNLLGKLHDLNLFNEHVHEKQLIVLNDEQKKEMLRYIYKRRAVLKEKVEKTGERLFNESSEDFSHIILNREMFLLKHRSI